MRLQKFKPYQPPTLVKPKRKQLTIPPFSLDVPTWEGESENLYEFPIHNLNYFSFKTPVNKFGENFLAAVRWKVGDITIRFAFWEEENSFFCYPVYAGQKIGPDAVIEIWSVESDSAPELVTATSLKTSELVFANVCGCKEADDTPTTLVPQAATPQSCDNPFDAEEEPPPPPPDPPLQDCGFLSYEPALSLSVTSWDDPSRQATRFELVVPSARFYTFRFLPSNLDALFSAEVFTPGQMVYDSNLYSTWQEFKFQFVHAYFPEAGTYYVEFNCNDATATVEVEYNYTDGHPVVLNEASDFSISRPAARAVTHEFEWVEGQVWELILQSVDIDTYLYVYDEENNVLASADDGSDIPNGSSRLTFVVPATGTYRVECTTFADEIFGEATLHVFCGVTSEIDIDKDIAEGNITPYVPELNDTSKGEITKRGWRVYREFNFSLPQLRTGPHSDEFGGFLFTDILTPGVSSKLNLRMLTARAGIYALSPLPTVNASFTLFVMKSSFTIGVGTDRSSPYTPNDFANTSLYDPTAGIVFTFHIGKTSTPGPDVWYWTDTYDHNAGSPLPTFDPLWMTDWSAEQNFGIKLVGLSSIGHTETTAQQNFTVTRPFDHGRTMDVDDVDNILRAATPNIWGDKVFDGIIEEYFGFNQGFLAAWGENLHDHFTPDGNGIVNIVLNSIGAVEPAESSLNYNLPCRWQLVVKRDWEVFTAVYIKDGQSPFGDYTIIGESDCFHDGISYRCELGTLPHVITVSQIP